MKITVLACTYDGESTERLKSFFEGLKSQTHKDFTILLCIDGDIRQELHDVIHDYEKSLQINILQNPKSNLPSNLNIGLSHITTQFTVRHDTDDVSRPDRLELQLKQIQLTKAAVVSGNIIEKAALHRRIKTVPVGWITKHTLSRFFKNPINHQCCIFDTKLIKHFGYPNTRMEDFILWSRLLNNGHKLYNIPIPLIEANVDGLERRRVGEAYRRAETTLFLENIQNNLTYAPIIFVSYVLRYSLRFPALIWLLKLALSTSRRKYN